MNHRSPLKRKLWAAPTLTTACVLALGLAVGVGVPAQAATATTVSSAASSASTAVPAGTETLWASKKPAGATVDSDRDSVELGTKFVASTSGEVVGVRFWKTAENRGTHVGNLWDASGKKLASATFKDETTSGWQTVTFSKPVTIKAGEKYVASYFAPKGRYSLTTNSTATSSSSVLSTDGKGSGGVYSYGSKSKFPTKSWQASNYWVDVVFKPGTDGSGDAGNGDAGKPQPPVTEPPTEPVVPPTTEPTPPTTDPTPPTTDPTPPGTGSSGSYAGASNTGPKAAGFAPTAKYTGPRTITTNGTVIRNQVIPAGLIVDADDVTIEGNIIEGSTSVPADDAAIMVLGKRAKVLNNEIRGLSASDWRQTPASGIKLYGSDVTLKGNNVYWIGGDAITIDANNVSIVGNWVHDFTRRDGVHYDAVVWAQRNRVDTPILVRDNTIEMWQPGLMTSVLTLPENAPKLTVDHNVLAGGGYTLLGGGSGSVITNNLFWTKFAPKAGAYGPSTAVGTVTWKDNFYSADGVTPGAPAK